MPLQSVNQAALAALFEQPGLLIRLELASSWQAARSPASGVHALRGTVKVRATIGGW